MRTDIRAFRSGPGDGAAARRAATHVSTYIVSLEIYEEDFGLHPHALAVKFLLRSPLFHASPPAPALTAELPIVWQRVNKGVASFTGGRRQSRRFRPIEGLGSAPPDVAR